VLRYDIHHIVLVDSEARPASLAGPLPPVFISGRGDGSADLNIYTGDFTYHGQEGFYYEGPIKLGILRSKFLLRGLEGRTELRVLSPRYRLFGEFRREVKKLIFEILELKLLQKGHTMLHAACVEKGGKGVVLVGLPNTGKTFTTIKLVRDHGFNFMSDDMAILGPGAVIYCFPTPMTIHPVHLRGLKLSLPWAIRFSVKNRWRLKSIRWLGRFVSEFKLDYRYVLGDAHLTEKARATLIFFLEQGPRGLASLDTKSALSKLVPVAKMHRSLLDELLVKYAYYHPELDLYELSREQDDLYRELVESADCFVVRAPDRSFADIVISEGLV